MRGSGGEFIDRLRPAQESGAEAERRGVGRIGNLIEGAKAGPEKQRQNK